MCIYLISTARVVANVRIRMMPGNLPRRMCLPAFFQRHHGIWSIQHSHMYTLCIVWFINVSLCITFYNIYRCVCQYWFWKYIRFFCSDTLNSHVFSNIRYIQYMQYMQYMQYIQIHTSSVQFALLYIVIYSFLHIRNIQNIMFTFDCEKDSRIGR